MVCARRRARAVVRAPPRVALRRPTTRRLLCAVRPEKRVCNRSNEFVYPVCRYGIPVLWSDAGAPSEGGWPLRRQASRSRPTSIAGAGAGRHDRVSSSEGRHDHRRDEAFLAALAFGPRRARAAAPLASSDASPASSNASRSNGFFKKKEFVTDAIIQNDKFDPHT